MPRQYRKSKPYIVVFCEGESEQAYTDFLKREFRDKAVIRRPEATGLFEDARDRFNKDPKFKNKAEETDEIWFFFDVETKDIPNWDKRYRIINLLRKKRKKPNIKVRLLMTSGCIEYWLMLQKRWTAFCQKGCRDWTIRMKEINGFAETARHFQMYMRP